jgi:hypothetical protein
MRTLNRIDPYQTVRQALPYQFTYLMTGKIQIRNLRGQILLVTRAEVERILEREDLDVHRRRMYEEALEWFKKEAGGDQQVAEAVQ